MDETFMSRVAERIAAATEAVSSISPMADPAKLPAVQTMDEWMASHSPDAKHRCVECKAPLVEGSENICVACGRPLPPRLAVRREALSFDKSLAKQLFYESVHLEDCQDTTSDTTELRQQEATSPGMATTANGFSQEQSPLRTGFGAETEERNVQKDEQGIEVVADANDYITPPPAESLSTASKKTAEEDEDDIWGSADADDFGARAWAQQFERGSGGDPKEVSVADNSNINSATKILEQTLSTDNNQFAFSFASSSADLSVSPAVETDFNYFASAGSSVKEGHGEQVQTAGPSSSKESLGLSEGMSFHDFLQVSPPVAVDQSWDQSWDPKVQTSDPFLTVGSTRPTVEDDLHTFFQVAQGSKDQSHRLNEETAVPLSAEESRSYNIETDFDDFFQGLPKSVDHSRAQNGETSVPHAAEQSSSYMTGTYLDAFFHGVSGSADLSRGSNVETLIPHLEAESDGQDGEADFDDFLEAAPRSDLFTGSKDESLTPGVTEDISVQREEPYFDFFMQTSPQSANLSRGQNVEAPIVDRPEKSSGPSVERDFDFFFEPPSSVIQLNTPKVEADAPISSKESIRQESDDHFADFFPVNVKSADEDHGQNAEILFPISAEENKSQKVRTDFDALFEVLPDSVKLPVPVFPAVEDFTRHGEADFDDFFQAAPVPAGPSPGHNKDEAVPNSAEGSVRQTIKTDFDSFFQASPNSAKGSGGQIAGTDFDSFFETPIKSESRVQDQHTQPKFPDIEVEAKGQTMEPDFDEFFQAAINPIKISLDQEVKAVATNPVEGSVRRNGESDIEDFFKSAPHSMNQSNGHNDSKHIDLFQVPTETPGPDASMGFDGFFSGISHSGEKSLHNSEKKDLDPFFQASFWSMDKSPEQNGTGYSSDGDFDDFVQAAPQSADTFVAPSHKPEVDSLFQRTPRLGEASQQSLTEDFDDFFQAAPQAMDKVPDVNTRAQFDFLMSSPQSVDRKTESADFGDLFQVPSPVKEVLKSPRSSSGLFVLGNGSGQINSAGASLTSTLTEGRSSNGESSRESEGRQLPHNPLEGHSEPPRKMPDVLSDLSFRLADQLVISDEAAAHTWSFS